MQCQPGAEFSLGTRDQQQEEFKVGSKQDVWCQGLRPCHAHPDGCTPAWIKWSGWMEQVDVTSSGSVHAAVRGCAQLCAALQLVAALGKLVQLVLASPRHDFPFDAQVLVWSSLVVWSGLVRSVACLLYPAEG